MQHLAAHKHPIPAHPHKGNDAKRTASAILSSTELTEKEYFSYLCKDGGNHMPPLSHMATNLGQVYTKPSVARYMTGLFTLPNGARVLDPCCGRGAFIDALTATGRYLVDGVEIDPQSYEECRDRESPSCRIHNADFFSFDATGQYDGVVMNPPYVRQEEIDLLAGEYGISKEKLAAKVCTGLDAKANLYMYFTIQALRALKDGGQLVVIFPNSWERSHAGEKFRKAMAALCHVEEHISVSGNPFIGAPIVDVEILKLRRGHSKAATIYKEILIDGDTLTERMDDTKSAVGFANAVPLAWLASVRRGKTTGCNRLFINPPVRENLRDILSSPKDVSGFSTANAATDKYLMITSPSAPLSAETKAYLQDCARWITGRQWPKSLYERIRRSECWYVTPDMTPGHVIFPYIIRENIRFIRNERRLLTRDNFYSITSPMPASLLMALLNNHYVWYQLEQCGKTYGNNVLKVQKYDVDNLMVISPELISADDKAVLCSLADALAATADTSLVGRITGVLAKYYAIDGIKTMFENARNQRLRKRA